MNNQNLFDKYSDGNHWENHSTGTAYDFVYFLERTSPICKEIKSGNFVITDLGCGNGRDVNLFNKYIPAIGLDNNPQMIQLAKETYPECAPAFYPCNIEQLPFHDNSQFAYFCINVLHYVDAPKVLGEIYRTLRHGGYAFIHFNLLIVDQDYSIDYHQKKSDVYELVKQFEIVEEKIFVREDTLPMPHTHHIMQVIIKKKLKNLGKHMKN